jgi:DNA uptake protein ComE-like DNA-binding protein
MFAKFIKTACLLTLAASAAACSSQAGSPENVGGANQPIAFPQAEKDLVVQFVNDPATDLDALDRSVGLDVRAAENILAHRAGKDGVYPSADDNRFDNLEELDAVPYVGDSALRKLRDFVVSQPAPVAELVEGVDFSAEQADAVVWGVNHATVDELRLDAGLIRPAAENLVASAPYSTVTQIGAVSQIGPAALTALRTHAPVWAAKMGQGGTSQAGSYDGIAYDEKTASIALSIANTASYEQLTVDGGLYSGGANAIVGARPFVTLGQVSDTYGVGASTMRALHDYAASGSF